MIYLGVLGLLFLLAIVFGILSAKTWRWPDILAGYLVFLAALSLVFLLSLSLKTRREWVRKVHELQKENATASAEKSRLLYGDGTSAALFANDNLTAVSYRLSRLLLDRGRVWRDTVPAAAGNDTYTITIPGADAEHPHQLTQRFVLHLFRENDVAEPGAAPNAAPLINVPTNYIGEFEVVAVSETGVQVRPILYSAGLRTVQESDPAGFAQQFSDFYINTGGQQLEWSLYETLPIDDHTVFMNPDVEPDLSVPGQPAFGVADPVAIAHAVDVASSNYSAVLITPEKRQDLIKLYTQDGQRSDPATNPPEGQVYSKVRLLKDVTEKVDTDVIVGGTAGVQFFDPQGRNQVDFLRAENAEGKGEVTAATGSVILVPKEQATALIGAGTAELIEDIYVRPLSDYSTALRSSYERLLEYRMKKRFTEKNRVLLTSANESIARMLQEKQEERGRLEADVAKVKYERQQMDSLVGQVSEQLNALKANIRALLADCLALEQQLEMAHRYIGENVDQAVREAVSTPGDMGEAVDDTSASTP